MPDLVVDLYCFINDRIWPKHSTSHLWAAVAYHLWKRLSIEQQEKVADRYAPF